MNIFATIWLCGILPTFFLLVFILSCIPYDKYNPFQIRLPARTSEETSLTIFVCSAFSIVWWFFIPILIMLFIITFPTIAIIKFGNNLSKNRKKIVRNIIQKTMGE